MPRGRLEEQDLPVAVVGAYREWWWRGRRALSARVAEALSYRQHDDVTAAVLATAGWCSDAFGK